MSGVGSAIDAYTSSLAQSNVYDSASTTPSTKYLSDLAHLKEATNSANLTQAQSILATAKLDAPDTVAGGMATAAAKGNIQGEAALATEATDNIRDYLVSTGYKAQNATAEATAIELSGFAENARNSRTSTAHLRLQQITDLATYAAAHEETGHRSAPVDSSDPEFNMFASLIQAKSGTAVNQSLTDLASLYGASQSENTSIKA